MSSFNILPEEILEHIFSFCGTYNVVNRRVCADFDPLVHLDYLLSCGEKIKLPPATNNIIQTSATTFCHE